MRFPLACLLAIGFADLAIADEPEKLVNALDAYYGEFPCAASIRVNTRHRCGGAIITRQHILTAAHCLDYVYDFQVTVVTGTSFSVPRATANSAVSNGVTYRILQMRQHLRYQSTTPNYWDIGIIKLADQINFNNFQSSISLPISETPRNTIATVAAWGSKIYRQEANSEWLQKLNVQIITRDRCQLYHLQPLPWHALCAESTINGGGSSLGDSGSPLIYNGQLIGILSGSIMTPEGSPIVYVSVYAFLDFIIKTVSI